MIGSMEFTLQMTAYALLWSMCARFIWWMHFMFWTMTGAWNANH